MILQNHAMNFESCVSMKQLPKFAKSFMVLAASKNPYIFFLKLHIIIYKPALQSDADIGRSALLLANRRSDSMQTNFQYFANKLLVVQNFKIATDLPQVSSVILFGPTRSRKSGARGTVPLLCSLHFRSSPPTGTARIR